MIIISRKTRFPFFLLLILGFFLSSRKVTYSASASDPTEGAPSARNIIVMIADGWGYKHLEAAEAYSGSVPAYRQWTHYGMTTYPLGGSYDPALAWTEFAYVMGGATDSAAAATAMFTGRGELP